MSRPPQQSERAYRWRGWLVPAALLALTPKCVLCLLAYAGIGGALVREAPELCGATGDVSGPWVVALMAAGFALGIAGLFFRPRRHIPRGARTEQS